MKGFFDTVKKKKDPCEQCGLYKDCNSPKMNYTGEGAKKILLIAQSPGKLEDQYGIQLIGSSGQLLRDYFEEAAGGRSNVSNNKNWIKLLENGHPKESILEEFDKYYENFNFERDCWKINSINCRPHNKNSNRTPSNAEISACRQKVIHTIKELKPEKIILIGKEAVISFLGDRWTKNLGGISKWIGMAIPDQDYRAWVFPINHPTYLLKQRGNEALENIFKKQIKQAIEWDNPFPIYNKGLLDNIIIIKELSKAKEILKIIIKKKPEYIGVDFEASGLKPYKKGHFIDCIGIATQNNLAYGIDNFNDPEFQDLLKQILTDTDIKKYGWNIEFEDKWSREIFGYVIDGWILDGMLSSHILDNRHGITGLKFQIYTRYGIMGYDNEINTYITGRKKGEKKSDNSFNRIDEASIDMKLKYVGIDAMFHYAIGEQLKKEIEEQDLQEADDLFFYGALSFSEVRKNGIRINEKYYEEQKIEITKKINELNEKISNSRPAIVWKNKKGKELNPNSGDQLSELFFNMMKIKGGRKTKTRYSVDETELQKIALQAPIAQDILRVKKLIKLKDTYIDGILRETVDGILRPNFNLNTVISYRSSSSSPNFQNQYKRWEEGRRRIRSGFIPRQGHRLRCWDYGGHEFSMAACHWEDPEMIKDASDPNFDVHRDWGMKLFKLTKRQMTSDIRFHVKNSFLFATLYGSYWENTGKSLWDIALEEKINDGILLINHLKSKGINTKNQFLAHVKKIEREFLNKYRVFDKRKRKVIDDYNRKGYIDLKTGFRAQWGKGGVMSINNILNTPVQSIGYHCLQWSLNRIVEIAMDEKWDTHVIGQIHDEINTDANPEEDEYCNKVIKRVMTEDIRNHWDWIVVPLKVEMEQSEINGNWYDMKKKEI